jgi:hypothetical protein
MVGVRMLDNGISENNELTDTNIPCYGVSRM